MIAFPTRGGVSEDIMKQVCSSGLRIGSRHKDYGLLELESAEKIA